MKKITTFLFGIFCMLSVANAQDITVFDFDGVSPSFTTYGDTFVSTANPLQDGVNSSANVGLYTHTSEWNEPFFVVDIDPTVYPTFEMMVYAPTAGSIAVGCYDASWNFLDWFSTDITVPATGWVKLTHALGSFTTHIGNISLRFNGGSTTTYGATVYYDNFVFKKAGAAGIASTREQVFSVYPNPATKYITTQNAQKVTILDLNGRIVKEAFNAEKVDVSSLAKGAYIVKAQIDNTTKIGKLIKE